jgi:hypothetical protein
MSPTAWFESPLGVKLIPQAMIEPMKAVARLRRHFNGIVALTTKLFWRHDARAA